MVDIETPDIVVAKTGVKINHSAHHAQVKAISDPSALQWSRDGSAVACAQDDKAKRRILLIHWINGRAN